MCICIFRMQLEWCISRVTCTNGSCKILVSMKEPILLCALPKHVAQKWLKILVTVRFALSQGKIMLLKPEANDNQTWSWLSWPSLCSVYVCGVYNGGEQSFVFRADCCIIRLLWRMRFEASSSVGLAQSNLWVCCIPVDNISLQYKHFLGKQGNQFDQTLDYIQHSLQKWLIWF